MTAPRKKESKGDRNPENRFFNECKAKWCDVHFSDGTTQRLFLVWVSHYSLGFRGKGPDDTITLFYKHAIDSITPVGDDP